MESKFLFEIYLENLIVLYYITNTECNISDASLLYHLISFIPHRVQTPMINMYLEYEYPKQKLDLQAKKDWEQRKSLKIIISIEVLDLQAKAQSKQAIYIMVFKVKREGSTLRTEEEAILIL